MELSSLLTPTSVVGNLRATCKKQALQELARTAAMITGKPERVIFDTILDRERLGTTGVGNGIAIPHGKVPGLTSMTGVFARLDRAVDFDAIDEAPVDLFFLLLAPEGSVAEHLRALAKVSRVLRDKRLCEKLRSTPKAEALYALLAESTLQAA